MYIIKNALRCIGRSKGRSILIGIIALVIAISACIGLSIRQAAESAKVSALEGMSITATIDYDRAGAMGNMNGGRPGSGGMPNGEFDKEMLEELMGRSKSLSLEEYQTYATAKSVKDFYYHRRMIRISILSLPKLRLRHVILQCFLIPTETWTWHSPSPSTL